MFKALWTKYDKHKAGDKQIRLRRDGPAPECVGEFNPLPSAPNVGVVSIYPRRQSTPFQLLCTLCHELGHAQSWLDGTRTEDYLRAHEAYKVDPRAMSAADKRLVLDEEIRAWRTGLIRAKAVGFTDEAAFHQEANRALGYYFDKMQLPVEVVNLADRSS